MEEGSNKKRSFPVPEPALRRMPCYLAYLKIASRKGNRYISSTSIARDIGVDSTQVTKDLSYTGISGKTRVGYEVESLIDALEDFLGFRMVDNTFLFGAGSLGMALIHDHGLKQYGLNIVKAFDIDPAVVGREIANVTIHHIDDFKLMREEGVEIAILTVPTESAQQVTDLMVEGGIRAIWNFTPVRIKVPDDVVVQNTSLYAHLAVMFNRLYEIKREKKY
ncbi:MAG: redox-sensing transcriptional repressor [Anaerophaga sp.]|nr:redox-sensing transcriptional repressor [Anaerophaga sp.]MDN5291215.1 redox-sensing transcriptional repressor [Anaerophaga sp.]